MSRPPRNLAAGLVLIVLRVQLGWRPAAGVLVVDLDHLLSGSLVAGSLSHVDRNVCQVNHPARLSRMLGHLLNFPLVFGVWRHFSEFQSAGAERMESCFGARNNVVVPSHLQTDQA
jgi:hypothetical protein